MSDKSIIEIAEGFGMSVEVVAIAEHANAFRIFKGANQVFIGTEEAVRDFLARYEKERPGLFPDSMFGYKE